MIAFAILKALWPIRRTEKKICLKRFVASKFLPHFGLHPQCIYGLFLASYMYLISCCVKAKRQQDELEEKHAAELKQMEDDIRGVLTKARREKQDLQQKVADLEGQLGKLADEVRAGDRHPVVIPNIDVFIEQARCSSI